MAEIKDETIALVVTSPPYPMIKKWDSLFGRVDFEYQHSILNRVWQECFRALIQGGICCINIGNATRTINKQFQCYPNYEKITVECKKIGFTPLIPIIWKKISNRPNAFLGSGFLPPNAYIAQDCEYIIILRKGKLRTFEPKEPLRYESKYTKKERDLWFQQIWTIPGKHDAKETSAFPEEIAYRLIRMFSIKNDTIVDPFSGTGTTRRIAAKLNRKFIGYELKQKQAKKRTSLLKKINFLNLIELIYFIDKRFFLNLLVVWVECRRGAEVFQFHFSSALYSTS